MAKAKKPKLTPQRLGAMIDFITKHTIANTEESRRTIAHIFALPADTVDHCLNVGILSCNSVRIRG